MTFVRTSPFAGAPTGFNHRAASAIYEVVRKLDDDTAEVFSDLLIGSIYQADLADHEVEIGKALDSYLDTHGDDLRERLLRAWVSKRANGEPVDGLTAAAVVVSKAFGDDPYDRDDQGHFASQEGRARRQLAQARQQHKDLMAGRYVKSHANIPISRWGSDGRLLNPAPDHVAERQGIPTPGRGLSPQQKLAYQQSYAQVLAMVQGHQRNPDGKYLHLHYPTGEEVVELPRAGEPLPVHSKKLPTAVSISEVPRFDDLSTFDTLGAMGGAVREQYPLGVGSDGSNAGIQRIRDLDSSLHADDPFERGGTRLMTRLGAGSKFLDESFQDKDGKSTLPRNVQAALKAGQVVGAYGPEAQRVIGPAADRAAYRYRGTERAPDRRLLNAMESLRRHPGIKTPEDRREIAVHGLETDNGWRPSGVLSYFRSRLPKANLNSLQTKSGTVPPSEGVILDAKGRIATQAVGYGDDHYLPFNLNKLRALKGGEYIRTRTFGGPTTEDVYTGLISGAKSLSVVSHNGVYTVEFDPSFKGSRRYNDKAARMVARYGYLLDAVKNGQITTGELDPSRRAELREQAGASYDPDLEHEAFRDELTRLTAREQRNPTFSREQRAQAAADFLDAEAMKHRTPDGHEMTRSELVDDWLRKQAVKQGELPDELATQMHLNHAETFNENAIKAMGLNERYERFTERAEKEYRSSLQPLKLNGPGYQLALEALQEQFPYYIKSVDYHPWTEGRTNVDTGYVKPKHTRSADVLAGYFDDTINGSAKVHADSIRGQGHARAARPYQSPAQRVAERARAASQGVTGGDRRMNNALTGDAARELRIQGDRTLAEHLRKQQAFSSALNGRSNDGAELGGAAGHPVADARTEDWNRISPDLREIMQTPQSELDRMDPDVLHRKLVSAMAAVEKHKVFDLDPKVVREFRDEGKAAPAKRFDRTAVGENLRNAGEEHDFGQRVYDKAHQPGSEDVERAYESGPGKVLGFPLDEAFESNIAGVGSNLAIRHRAVLDWQRNGANPMHRPDGSERLPHDVEAYLRAKQLHRRHGEAIARETPEPDAPPDQAIGFGGGVNRIELVLPGGGVLAPANPQQQSERDRFDAQMLADFGTT